MTKFARGIWLSSSGELELRLGGRSASRAHSHIEHLFVLVRRGRYVVTFKDGAHQDFGPNATAYIPAGVVHAIEPLDSGWVVGVYVRSVALQRYTLVPGGVDRSPAVVVAEDFTDVLQRAIAAITAPDAVDDEAALCDAVIAPLAARFAHVSANWRPKGPLFATARNFLVEHLDEQFRLADLSRATGRSKAGIERLFAELTRCGPRAYQHQLRSSHARALLRDGRPIREVAECCGYADQAHFTRAFRNSVGMTPGQFARAIRASSGRQ